MHEMKHQQTAGLRDLVWVPVLLALTIFLAAGSAVGVCPKAGQPLLLSEPVYAAQTDAGAGDSQSDESSNTLTYAADDFEAQAIHVPFIDTATVAYEWDFPYADDFFRQPSGAFSRSMAQGSLGLAISAFRSDKHDTLPLQYETYLTEAGFTDLVSFGYGQPTGTDTLSGVIGQKKIGKFTVLAATTCGQGYGGEWAGNLKVGDGEIHEGFQQAAGLLEAHLDDYIQEQGLDRSRTKLWLTGISRAAAVANLTAADAIRSGEWKDVYAYLFGVPRTTKNPQALPGIYNICGQYDPVAQTPLQSWGYERYGTDLFTPAQETNSDYPRMAAAASRVSDRLCGDMFRNNPEMNHQIHLVLEYMGAFFPESSDYADRLQAILMRTWKDPTQDNIVEVVAAVILQMNDLNKREKNASRSLFRYVAMVAAQHTRANSRQVADGSWNPAAPLEANMILEHRPSTYLNWLFADVDSEDLFTFADATRWISFKRGAEVAVYQGDQLLGEIDTRGRVSFPETVDSKTDQPLPEPYMASIGKESVMNLPEDAPYRIVVTAPKEKRKNIALAYRDLQFTTAQLPAIGAYRYSAVITPGSYEILVTPGKQLPQLRIIDGDADITPASLFTYSPVEQMNSEAAAADKAHLPLDSFLEFLLIVLIALGAIGLVHAVLLVRHAWRRRHDGPSHARWLAIAPFLFYVLVFMGLTLLVTYELFIMSKPRAACAAVAVIFVALLALRGSFHCPQRRNFLISAALFALSIPTYLFYGWIPQGMQFDVRNVLLYVLVMGALCFIAIGTFYGFRFRRGAGKEPA